MSIYTAQRSRNLFLHEGDSLYKISRSKIQDFLDCPRCFYLDRRCGTAKPGSLPFTLNTAVDSLLKAEFDGYRAIGMPHPLMTKHEIAAVPFKHSELDEWRMNLKGIQILHQPTNFIITGAIDDLWINQEGELIVVDYKATSTNKEITLDEEYRQSYKNQMEVYQWLLRKKGFLVSNKGYFVYCNADSTKKSFEGKLEFSISVLPYEGNDTWIEPKLFQIRQCLESNVFPQRKESCAFCSYRAAVRTHLKDLE